MAPRVRNGTQRPCAQRLRRTSRQSRIQVNRARCDVSTTPGRLAITRLALEDEWLDNISHGPKVAVGEQLLGVHCAEVVQDEGARIAEIFGRAD